MLFFLRLCPVYTVLILLQSSQSGPVADWCHPRPICGAGKPRFPTHFAKELRDLLKNLLQPDITKRYGMLKNGVSDIKDASFFKGMDWIALYHREVATEHVPEVKGPDDASHYEVYQEVRAVLVAGRWLLVAGCWLLPRRARVQCDHVVHVA